MSGELAELARDADALPDGWHLRRLGDVARLGGGTTPARGEAKYWDGATIPWATPSDITSLSLGVSTIDCTENMVTEKALVECSLPLNVPGTVLMTSRATIGFAAINAVPMTTNQGFITFNPCHDLCAQFLLQWLIAQRPNLVAAAGGSTFKELSRGTAKLLPISLPPLIEQRQIAEVLRSIDEAIAATENLAKQFQTVWNVLTEKLIWDRLATSGEVAQPLGNALIGSDYGVNAPLGNEKVGHAVLRMGNLQDGWIDPTDMKWGEIGVAEAKALALDVGDLLFNRTNSRALVGKVALVREPTDFLYASYIVRLRVNRAVADPYYLFAAMHSRRAQAQFKSIATPGVSQSNINPTNLKKQIFPLPCIAEQRDVTAQLQSTESAQRSALDQLAILRQIKTDLMRDLLVGRVRVPAVFASTSKSVPPAFKRAVFAAEIVYQLHNHNRFGSVKHEKIVHLCELHLGLQGDLDRHAYKEAAGPYDPKARRSVEKIFQQQKWFDVTKPEGSRVVYTPLEKAGGHAQYFDRYFGEHKHAIQSVIDLMRPLDTPQCEIIATLYSVWNDFLIDGRQPTDDEIVASVLQWHPKKQEISEDRWQRALPWMRMKGLVPKGIGKKTRVAKA